MSKLTRFLIELQRVAKHREHFTIGIIDEGVNTLFVIHQVKEAWLGRKEFFRVRPHHFGAVRVVSTGAIVDSGKVEAKPVTPRGVQSACSRVMTSCSNTVHNADNQVLSSHHDGLRCRASAFSKRQAFERNIKSWHRIFLHANNVV